MISPWTTIIVHIAAAVKGLLYLAGFVSSLVAIVGVAIYIVNADKTASAANIGKKLAAGSCIIIALAATAHVLIPPSAALARVLVTQQLPEDADIEVVDELVYRVCNEASGK